MPTRDRQLEGRARDSWSDQLWEGRPGYFVCLVDGRQRQHTTSRDSNTVWVSSPDLGRGADSLHPEMLLKGLGHSSAESPYLTFIFKPIFDYYLSNM